MKALQTQFDDIHLSATVSTPTCAGCCCCCCCCLTTSVGSSFLLSQSVSEHARRQKVPHRNILGALAALYILITALVAMTLVMIYSSIVTPYITWYHVGGLTIISAVLVVWLLYAKARAENSLIRALAVVMLVTIAYIIEVMVMANMIAVAPGSGIIGYLMIAGLSVAVASIYYGRYLDSKFPDRKQKPGKSNGSSKSASSSRRRR